MHIEPNDALLVVDVQNDFLPGGSLAVAQGRRILAPINRLMPRFPFVAATRDWHPPEHRFFSRHGGPWPDHCLQGTRGAEFDAELEREHVDAIVSKGVDPQTDGYSGFAGTGLEDDLRGRGIRRVFVCGLATDYCVKATALDAKRHGFETFVIGDAIAAVNLEAGDEERALGELRAAGIPVIESDELLVSSPSPR
ncbi:MAG: nicotinamidase [Candidatus Eremiobacteraeota bacterium]|nr:nicotinamidase [Candidatus Eremiobacteraeota bacterium]